MAQPRGAAVSKLKLLLLSGLGMILLGTASSLYALKPLAPIPTKLLADEVGAIEHLLIHFADYDNIPTLYAVLKKMPSSTRISIAVPKGERTKLLQSLIQGWQIAQPKRLDIISLQEPMTFWIRDEFVVASNNTMILPKRYGYNAVPESLELLSKKLKLKTMHALIDFDGGNVVSAQNRVMVGYNMIKANRSELFSSDAEVTAYLRQLFGKPITVIGDATHPPPHEHIDMLITPIANDEVVVADPTLAIEILQKNRPLLNSGYEKIYFNETTTPIPAAAKKQLWSTADFVERLDQDLGIRKPTDITRDSDITLALLYAKNNLPSVRAQFEFMLAQLKKQGFRKIHRIPVLMNHDIENGPFITYNNMLLEERGKQRTVYLPAYNIAPLDQEAKSIMTKLGYKVISVDVQNIAFYDGTLRCISQILKRSK